MKAALTCGQAVTTVLASAPTVVGAVLGGIVGGLACGLASAEAYDCYSKRP
jgi:predicted lipid-binding transport protein (Tim44 family)